ncbi:ABC transporter permease [Sphaerisporangium rubeum]|uniref:Spermidine/putrescine transport system permease protein n=1 Tax=Sphaerisporangium rubeum TaxID=321317 RepID=A0A7X0IDK5_9ACTN|nr:ABC transporter permease [Sphaerisporangium rubeum]MBB6473050.1 spermidine/putrescine transport system permease protein [Sphaerisporangium rubeum]
MTTHDVRRHEHPPRGPRPRVREERSRRRAVRRGPVVLATLTWLYVAWSLLPVLVAVQFSFNAGRSRSTWQGFSLRWYAGDPASVAADPGLHTALVNSLVLAALTTLVATPLGVALAIGLARWRGRTGRAAGGLMLLPLATPEIVMGSALYLVFTNLYLFVPLGRPAMVLGHVTFSVSYVVIIVRSRLASIGDEYETAARDLGASRLQALRLVVLPLLTPAVFASAMIVFASSMDDFVISAFLSPDASSVTVPIKLYSAVRTAPTPALNALATLLLAASALALVLAWLVLRRRGSTAALRDMASM